MGERKVLNFHLDPDMDPSIIPRIKRNREKLVEVRMMLPFSLRCNTCGEYMYRGKKFNSKKEDIMNETYMGVRIIRFYIKCSVCSAEITFKTDPQNSDYVCESGASRNFELWRETQRVVEEEEKNREEEEELDAMKALENRTMDNKIEMDVLDALDEIRAINQRHQRVDTNKVLEALAAKNQPIKRDPSSLLTEEDEKEIQNMKFGIKTQESNDTLNNSNNNNNSILSQLKKQMINTNNIASTSSNPIIITKKKRKLEESNSETIVETKSQHKEEIKESNQEQNTPTITTSTTGTTNNNDTTTTSSIFGLLGDYGDDENDE